ncbi:MAG: hypothetical protein HYU56_05430 [Candidatus Aenigmarchaeota archaeon]|nr:hypothetical protein [Candidatus Aenigmarchaeota archaeon]
MGLIVKIYGTVDIVAGLLIYFYAPLPDIIKLIILGIMLFKGIPSLFG